jgi:hypothetical protein
MFNKIIPILSQKSNEKKFLKNNFNLGIMIRSLPLGKTVLFNCQCLYCSGSQPISRFVFLDYFG